MPRLVMAFTTPPVVRTNSTSNWIGLHLELFDGLERFRAWAPEGEAELSSVLFPPSSTNVTWLLL